MVGAKEINRQLVCIDVWTGDFDRLEISTREDCPACRGKYEFLEGKFGIKTTSLCGQNMVQIVNTKARGFSLKELEARLKPVVTEVSYNEFMLRFTADNHEMVVFSDGRAILRNTTDGALARGLYAKYIGT